MYEESLGEEADGFDEALSCRCARSSFLVDQNLQCIQPQNSTHARQLPQLQGVTGSASTSTKHAGSSYSVSESGLRVQESVRRPGTGFSWFPR